MRGAYREGCWLATADLAEDRLDVGSGDTPREAVRSVLQVLGEPSATEMAEGADRWRCPRGHRVG